MGLTVNDNGSGGDFKPVEEGTHVARCVRLIDLGTQPGSQQYPTARPKVLIAWELPDVTEEFEGMIQPRFVMKRYTASLNDKAGLRHDLQTWRGRGFTEEELKGFKLSAILGQPCMVTVVHSKDGQYANVAGVSAMPARLRAEVPEAFHDLLCYEIEDGTGGVWSKLSEKLQQTIQRAPEWSGPVDPDAAPGSDDDPGFQDDDIPF